MLLFSTCFSFQKCLCGASLLRVHCGDKGVCEAPKGHMSGKKSMKQHNPVIFPSVNILLLHKVLLKDTLKCSITNSPFLLYKPCFNIAYPCLTSFPDVWHALSSDDLSWCFVHVKHCCNSHGVKWLHKNTQINIVNCWTLQNYYINKYIYYINYIFYILIKYINAVAFCCYNAAVIFLTRRSGEII